MADLGAIDSFETLKDEYADWATAWDEADDALYTYEYVKLARIKREKLAFLERIATGGRTRKRKKRTNAWHHQRLIDVFFGTPAFTEDGVVHEAIHPRHFTDDIGWVPTCLGACSTKFRIQSPDTKSSREAQMMWVSMMPLPYRNLCLKLLHQT